MVAAVVTAAGSGAVLDNADDYAEARVEPTPGSDDLARRSKLLGASLRRAWDLSFDSCLVPVELDHLGARTGTVRPVAEVHPVRERPVGSRRS
jgi:hypothetical protein